MKIEIDKMTINSRILFLLGYELLPFINDLSGLVNRRARHNVSAKSIRSAITNESSITFNQDRL